MSQAYRTHHEAGTEGRRAASPASSWTSSPINSPINSLAVFLAAALMVVALVRPAMAEQAPPAWPGVSLDPAIPTVADVLGYESGSRITTHADMVRYMQALKDAAPDRIKLFRYGETWEGRALIYAAIAKPETLARLDSIKQDTAMLADPRGHDDSALKAAKADLPVITWLAYSVHGNEVSGADAAMQTAYHLLAARDSQRVDSILENSIAIINPLQNPDGRDRFINRFRIHKGVEASADRLSAEHNEPWPSGRTNHYMFDLNRDWLALTQPETRGHVKALRQWMPQVFVDLHEMGGDSTYYFAPEAVPYNPHLTGDQRDSLFLFGKNNARHFDRFGIPYFTRDVYDAFYPGYGASWPAYFGAVSMTYEQASARGLRFRKSDGTELTFRDSVQHHFIASISTLEAAAANRARLLDDFLDYQRSAIEEGRKSDDRRSYIFPNRRDAAGHRKLMGVLGEMGIEVQQTTGTARACGETVPQGAYVIDAAQPRKRMINTLLNPQVDMEADFVAEQERKRGKDLPHDIYDVTAWSLAKMYNLDMKLCGKPVDGPLVPAGRNRVTPGTLTADPDSIAYLVEWGDMAAVRLLAGALKDGLVVKATDETFTQNGKTWPRGTLIFPVGDNAATLPDTLKELAVKTGANVVGTASGWVSKGAEFGARSVHRIHTPRIAMAWDEPTSSYSAGNSRFVIEHQIGLPVTVIRTDDLKSALLERYDVLILPDEGWGGSYADSFGETGVKTLSAFVERGGVLIGQKGAVNWLADPDTGLLSTRREYQLRDDDAEKKDDTDDAMVAGTRIASKNALHAATTPAEERPDSIPGALIHARTDPDNWLTNGVADRLNVLVRGRGIFTPLKRDKGVNAVHFEGAEDLLSSGYLWQENRRQLAYKPFAMVEKRGRGLVIAFTEDPTIRAYLDGLGVIYANAVLTGSAHANPLR
ncbi:M14 metallopeptidase family protein [Yunchengibacter salinarum]|uniref:M14 metallopeptidase family protein n=1 Tax=Yunchengibacter salinarum TaxID=3133399 RepID=UPI0035B5F071